MIEWQFKSSDGKISLNDECERLYARCMAAALLSHCNPNQSNYPVLSAGLTEANIFVCGGNIEYGMMGRGIHSEEALVGAAIQVGGKNSKLSLIGIISGVPGNVAMPCGNCRDLLEWYCTADAVIVCGSPTGGEATVMRLSSYFNEDFKKLEVFQLNESGKDAAMQEALRSERNAYHPCVLKEKVYGASFSCESSVFGGHFAGDSAFHPVFPIRNAISTLHNSTDNDKFRVTKLTIVQTGRKPSVPYIERQHLLEFECYLRKKYRRSSPIDVRLIETDTQGAVVRAWKTNSTEWIPYAFRPENLE
ncbi:MAG: hypothetical protein Q7K43_06940 [Candidatus Woesearchaeota archaeon]|nr:hypothetical protein [Candidatus Woesearchaeota archaeon]